MMIMQPSTVASLICATSALESRLHKIRVLVTRYDEVEAKTRRKTTDVTVQLLQATNQYQYLTQIQREIERVAERERERVS